MSDSRRAGGAPGVPTLAPDLVVLGRYRLMDRVADTAGTSLWRGLDERLRRPVAVRFMPLDSAVAADLRAGAAAASHVTDRRAVPVLDIDEDLVTERLVVVTEWLAGTALGDLLSSRRDPMPPREAAVLTLEVARFLAAAAEAGVAHGRVRPNCVVVTDTGEVRVRGLGVDRVLYGVSPGEDPVAADIHGAGAILYSCLTGRWPGVETMDGIAPVPSVDRGRVPWPSRVVADVPRGLDEVTARALLTTQLPKGGPRFGSAAEMVSALTAVLRPESAPVAPQGREPWRPWVRTGAVLLFAFGAVGLAGLGLQMVQGLGGTPLNVPRTDTPSASSPTPTVSSTAVPVGTRAFPIVSARDFDPYGDTQKENPQLAPLAIDGKVGTAWTTVRYRQADMSGKPGVGLLLDLGAPRPVSAVELQLVGNGTDLSIRATDDPTKKPEQFRSLADVTGAGSTLTLRVPRPVTTRYVLVWFTALPPEGSSFQGGIAEVRVLG